MPTEAKSQSVAKDAPTLWGQGSTAAQFEAPGIDPAEATVQK